MTCETGKVENVLIDDQISKIWAVDGQIWQKKTGSRSIKRRLSLERLARIMPCLPEGSCD